MVEHQGFGFEVDALYTYAEAGHGLVASVTAARSGLDGAGPLPSGVFGEVGETSGFVAAYAERAASFGATMDAIGRGLEGLSIAVRGYVDSKVQQEDVTATDLRRSEEPV
ncbi:MAG TPA: hypothetical protein VGD67_05835 [Pseudonocardiaceae bacterium]